MSGVNNIDDLVSEILKGMPVPRKKVVKERKDSAYAYNLHDYARFWLAKFKQEKGYEYGNLTKKDLNHFAVLHRVYSDDRKLIFKMIMYFIKYHSQVPGFKGAPTIASLLGFRQNIMMMANQETKEEGVTSL